VVETSSAGFIVIATMSGTETAPTDHLATCIE
jgi:hypothetical protein